MGRPAGARSAGHEERRAALLGAVRRHLLERFPERPSFREAAAAAGVSVPTLRHYFSSRDGLIAACLEAFGLEGAPYLARLAHPDLPFERSVPEMAAFIASGLVPSLARPHAVALAEAMGQASVGPAYLDHVLEPMLQAAERRLSEHQRRGEMRAGDVRAVALQIVAPLLLAALHQHQLDGARVRPLDLHALAAALAGAVTHAYRSGPAPDPNDGSNGVEPETL